jgi:hypothetical protein
LKRFGANVYEIELPDGIGISTDIQHIRFVPM